jgi:hypothetical protein
LFLSGDRVVPAQAILAPQPTRATSGGICKLVGC